MFADEFFVISFDSTSHSMRTEKLARQIFRTAIIPTPVEITSECGFSLRFVNGTQEEIVEFFHTLDIPCSLYYLGSRGADGMRERRLISTKGGDD